MHLVHHQFGLLRPHTEHELIWRKCLFEFGKSVFYSYSHLSWERERETKKEKQFRQLFTCIKTKTFNIRTFVERHFKIDMHFGIVVVCGLCVRNVFVQNEIYSHFVRLTCFDIIWHIANSRTNRKIFSTAFRLLSFFLSLSLSWKHMKTWPDHRSQ